MSFLVALTCLTIAAAAPDHHEKREAFPTKNIAELAIATPQLSTLLAAVKAAGLVETLASEGPFTVFAPTNKAFAKIPKTTLNGLLADKDALTAHSGLAGGCFRKKMKFELVLLLDSLDPYGSRKNEIKLH